MVYFSDCYIVNENAQLSEGSISLPIIADKIVINHYYLKSREEFLAKVERGSSARTVMIKKLDWLEQCDRNEEFDDDILKYREERTKVYQQPDDSYTNERLLSALAINLSPFLYPDKPPKFYVEKEMETFLTCYAVAVYLQERLADNVVIKFFEMASLRAILQSLDDMSLADAQLLIRELPNFLNRSNPAVKELLGEIIQRLPKIKHELRLKGFLREFVGLDYLQKLFEVKG